MWSINQLIASSQYNMPKKLENVNSFSGNQKTYKIYIEPNDIMEFAALFSLPTTVV